eukprot:462370_1
MEPFGTYLVMIFIIFNVFVMKNNKNKKEFWKIRFCIEGRDIMNLFLNKNVIYKHQQRNMSDLRYTYLFLCYLKYRPGNQFYSIKTENDMIVMVYSLICSNGNNQQW